MICRNTQIVCGRITSLYATNSRVILKRNFHENKYDVAVIGGGIVGCAVAQEITKRNPDTKCVIIEKEKELATHQTGHNSGVIHVGIYYKPGSLKARLCVRGFQLLYDYCDEYKIPYKKVGKLIVATNDEEELRLGALYEQGIENKVSGLSLITADEIKQIEPYCKGKGALHSSNTGIVDYSLLTKAYGRYVCERGGTFALNYEVNNITFSSTVDPQFPILISGKNQSSISCRYLITCAGLFADRIATMTLGHRQPAIVPFRGDYLMLKPEKTYLVKGNIYPVPNPLFPFLGVHFTPRMDDSVWLGPNAVLAFNRQGYRLTDFSVKDTLDVLTHKGFWRLLANHWKFACQEVYGGIFTRVMVEQLQKFIPELTVDDVQRGPSGVRAMALQNNGELLDDFVFDEAEGEFKGRCLHVRNAPSPAATSSLAIAEIVAEKFEKAYSRI